MKISIKLPAVIVCIGFAGAIAVGLASYMTASGTLAAATQARLTAIAEAQQRAAADLMKSLETSALSTAANKNTLAALMEFRKSWEQAGSNPAVVLQEAYVAGNPKDAGAREDYDSAGRSPYDKAHKTFHPALRGYRQETGLKDILLLDPDGNVVYSVAKTSDFAVNVADPAFAESDLALVFQSALAAEAKAAAMTPVRPYAGLGGEPASFVAAPLTLGKKLMGVVVLVVDVARLDAVLANVSGIGETGDVLLVHENGEIQNESARTPETAERLTTDLGGPVVAATLAGAPTYGVVDDFRSGAFNAAAVPLEILGNRMAVVVLQGDAEVMAPLAALRTWLIGISVAVAAVAGFAGLVFSRRLTGRLARLQAVMADLASGKLDTEVPADRSDDEISAMAEAVTVF
ncbi:MAG TPA: HAMP domain-containing protein, partial [Methylomirabilota bacterium]|nr:HAMP domain-containing protein [Methylomirabilota bacterium]